MKLYNLTGFAIDKLTIVDATEPKPGPGEVLVKMGAWSLNYRDLLVARGIYMPNLQFPFVPLSDGAGTVEAVGEGVTRFKSRDRVTASFMQGWIEGPPTHAKQQTALGGNCAGIAGEYVVLHESGLVATPANLSDEEAATLPCAALTAWNALVDTGHLQAGETVLVQGTGGVSIFALQFAKMMGARVIATSSSDAKLEQVKALGADEVINYKTTPKWGAVAREMTAGRGVDHIVEVGGAGTMDQSLDAVRTGGRISYIGVLTMGAFNPIPILFKTVTVAGIFVGSREMLEAMNRAITLNGIKPVIDRVFPFAQLPDAMRHMEAGAHFGKIVVKA